MTSFSVIVTVYNNPAGLKYTLEGLVEQTTEDFEVLIVDDGSTDDTADVIKTYCDEYVGFTSLKTEHAGVPSARNTGVENVTGELVYFIDAGDYISPESIEKILRTAEETKADIITPRYYISGENEPYYDSWMDMLSVVPHIDRFDRALLNTMDYSGRVYRKKFFDLYALRFPDIPVLYNTQFLMKCALSCGAAISGCAGAVYDRKSGIYSGGFPENGTPGADTFSLAVSTYESIFSDIKAIIEEETGGLDGDEYTVQEFLSVYFDMLTNSFYRYFWYLDDSVLSLIRDKYEELSKDMLPERKKRINTTNSDLRFPAMYITKKDAAAMPMFSLVLDIRDTEDMAQLVNSLFVQKFPFFELFVKTSDMNSGFFPERWKTSPNVHELADEDFFKCARNESRGVVIAVKDASALDPRILSELSVAKVPKAMLQYMFTSKRKTYSTKRFLKSKGLAMQ